MVAPTADVEGDEDDLEDTEDSLTYSNGVIEKIVAMATREVPHVLGMKATSSISSRSSWVPKILPRASRWK